jgi:tetratricopeptide (TPR) repeat protein
MAPSMARPLMLALALATLSACTTGTRSDLAIREKGDYEFNRGNYEVARVEYLEYSKLRPGRPDVLHNLGVCALKTGRTDEALHFLRLAYDLEPQNVEYTDNLAEAMYTAGKYDELYELLRDRTKQPGTVNDYLRLGEFAERMGDPDEAENALRTAAKIDRGQSVEPQLALADFYRAMGDTEMETLRLKMALFLAPDHDEINERIRLLGHIPGPTFARAPEEMDPDLPDPR